MNVSILARSAFRVLVAFPLAMTACSSGASHLAPPVMAPQTLGSHRGAMNAHPLNRSWMDPGATKLDLVYLSDWGTGKVRAYSYPKGKLEGTLTNLSPAGLCVDKAGDVFVDNSRTHSILEYPHGGTSPIAVLDDSDNIPSVCSIDPITGNLAVANSGNAQGISIFEHAKGSPTIYADPNIPFVYFCGYDNRGNLYLDGFGSQRFQFARLAHGSHAFTKITLDQTIHWPGAVQWDGKYMAVGEQGINGNGSVIYRFAIHANHGMKVGATPLGSSREVVQFWIDPPNVIGPDNGGDYGSAVKFWDYPRGGSPNRSLGGFDAPWGSTVSKGR